MEFRHDDALRVGPPSSYQDGYDRALWRCEDQRPIATAGEAAEHARALSAGRYPALMVLYLDSDFRLLATELLGSGNLGQSGIKPMRIIGQAGRLGAMGFILVHHDSSRTAGSSLEEHKATVELRRLGEEFNVYLLHHFIIGRDRTTDVFA